MFMFQAFPDLNTPPDDACLFTNACDVVEASSGTLGETSRGLKVMFYESVCLYLR
jgi:hypothetical protein